MATSDHNMVDSENSETSSEATLKKQTVRFAELPRDELLQVLLISMLFLPLFMLYGGKIGLV